MKHLIHRFRLPVSVRSVCTPALCLLLAVAGLLAFRGRSESVSARTENRCLPIYCVNTDKPKVSVSFDAAWGNEDTATLLSILSDHNVKTTFFMTGGWVESYPDDVRAIAAAGHDLGNHSENHKQMSTLSAAECREELQQVHDKVKELTGRDMTLFRPPYGDYNDTLIETANDMGYHVIQWDVDSLDWKDYGAEAIVSKVLDHPHLGNGSIILMHNGAKYTKDALDELLTGLTEKGYEIVPISQLIYTENYEMDHEGRQSVKEQ
ncbi:MAG: polysaccharide deacetylase family protein [Eubacteriales bacterium]|nr:polysaccharide deacetylase family protein [Eubacteriales bacterium]